MRNDSEYGSAHVLLAFLAGAALGSAVALLSAPRAGSDTRGAIRGWAQSAGGKAGRLPDALRQAYRQASEAARKAFNESLREHDEA